MMRSRSFADLGSVEGVTGSSQEYNFDTTLIFWILLLIQWILLKRNSTLGLKFYFTDSFSSLCSIKGSSKGFGKFKGAWQDGGKPAGFSKFHGIPGANGEGGDTRGLGSSWVWGSSCDELFALQPHHGYLEKTVGQNYSLNTFWNTHGRNSSHMIPYSRKPPELWKLFWRAMWWPRLLNPREKRMFSMLWKLPHNFLMEPSWTNSRNKEMQKANNLRRMRCP